MGINIFGNHYQELYNFGLIIRQMIKMIAKYKIICKLN